MQRLLASLLGVMLIVTIIGGCDFLEKEPLGELTSENFFETQQDAVQATNATYNMLRDWSVHVFSWIGMTDIVSDDATKGSTPSDASFLLELDNLTWDAGNTAFRSVWEGYYQGIYRANVAIQNIPDIDMDEQMQARLIGENKFLRAYYYFFLVRAFGGVPLVTEPLTSDEFEQSRASAEEVYALIEQDLQDASEALPRQSEYPTNQSGRATEGAAEGLLAKVHLFQGEYQEALDHAERVIESEEYALHPSYPFIFSVEGEFSSGSIFEIQSASLEMGGAASQYAGVQGVRGNPNLGWGFNQPSPDLEVSYEPGDPRRQATILYPWEHLPDGSGAVVHINPNLSNQRYNEKVTPPLDHPGGSGNTPVNIRRLRYADVLLIAAEAAYETGNTGKAQEYLNRVRRRARDDQNATLGITPDRLDERLVEENLGLDPNTSRVFVRFVDEGGPAYEAGLQSFQSVYLEREGAELPALVQHVDIIQSVGGTEVATLEEYLDALRTTSPGETVTVEVLRVSQQAEGGEVSTDTETRQFDVTAVALLPDVMATGPELLEAIWHERRAELAMEQHRWFDIIRQGRADELMEDVGKNFVEGTHELYPIPQSEIDLSGGMMEQNPEY